MNKASTIEDVRLQSFKNAESSEPEVFNQLLIDVTGEKIKSVSVEVAHKLVLQTSKATPQNKAFFASNGEGYFDIYDYSRKYDFNFSKAKNSVILNLQNENQTHQFIADDIRLGYQEREISWFYTRRGYVQRAITPSQDTGHRRVKNIWIYLESGQVLKKTFSESTLEYSLVEEYSKNKSLVSHPDKESIKKLSCKNLF